MNRALVRGCVVAALLAPTAALSLSADETIASLREALQGNWGGDVEAYKKANPNPNDELGETYHRTLEYKITETGFTIATIFMPRPAVPYAIVDDEKDRLTIEIRPPGQEPAKGQVVFTDKDHITITFEGKKPSYLKRRP